MILYSLLSFILYSALYCVSTIQMIIVVETIIRMLIIFNAINMNRHLEYVLNFFSRIMNPIYEFVGNFVQREFSQFAVIVVLFISHALLSAIIRQCFHPSIYF